MICCLGPTIGISRYINRLLQPIYDQMAYSTTFFKESNAVHALENYVKQGLLRSNTLFATLHVNNGVIESFETKCLFIFGLLESISDESKTMN